jgi:ketosteroid isomerase-like protein
MKPALIPLVVFLLAGCTPDSSVVEADVQQFVRAYITSSDITASLGMLDQSVTVTSITGEGVVVRGRDAIRDAANKQITLMPQLKVTVGGIEVGRAGAGYSFAIAPFSVATTGALGSPMATGAATLILAKRDSGWKVVHEHYSYARAPGR